MRFLMIPLAVLAVIVLLLDDLLILLFVGEKVAYAKYFLTGARREMKVPGTWSDYVQQGFDQLDDGTFVVSAYHKDDDNAAVFVMAEEDDNEVLCELKTPDGSPYLSHAGGVTHFQKWLYIANDNHADKKGLTYCMHDNCDTELDMFLLSDVLDGDGVATQVGSITIPNRLAYASVYGNTLYAGAFHRKKTKYITPEAHHITTPAGDKNTALMMTYTLDAETGRPTTEFPQACYSTISNVQGMCITGEGNFVLSTSWGLGASRLYHYEVSKAASGTISINNHTVPLYYLDSSCLKKKLRTPPMAEELVWMDGRVYILTESASTKYLFGKVTSGNRIYSYPMN